VVGALYCRHLKYRKTKSNAYTRVLVRTRAANIVIFIALSLKSGDLLLPLPLHPLTSTHEGPCTNSLKTVFHRSANTACTHTHTHTHTHTQELNIEPEEVESLLVACILDSAVHGRIDQVNQILELDQEPQGSARWVWLELQDVRLLEGKNEQH